MELNKPRTKRTSMRLTVKLIFCLIVIFQSINAIGQTTVDKTQVLVLGTHHLNQIKNFQPKMLDNLIIKLDSLEFDAICIEKMPGELLYDIKSRKDSAFIYITEHKASTRLSLANSMQEKLGIGFLESEERAGNLLKKESLSNTERVHLIEYLIAATDIYSATLQYHYVKEKSIFNRSRVGQHSIDKMQQYSESLNEISSLALKLAHNQNLQKLEYIDNFQDEPLLYKHFPYFRQDFADNKESLKDVLNSPVFLKINELVESCIKDKDFLELYLFMNSKEFTKQDFEAQHEIWLKTKFASGSDRARYSLWEMRNLQISANILKTCAFYPGKKILVIIGASHKSFIEKYLKQISDIELLELNSRK